METNIAVIHINPVDQSSVMPSAREKRNRERNNIRMRYTGRKEEKRKRNQTD